MAVNCGMHLKRGLVANTSIINVKYKYMRMSESLCIEIFIDLSIQ